MNFITNEDRAILEAYDPEVLAHHGIIGMKWGVRRYQNEDGTLTQAGKKRYGSMSDEKLYKTLKKQVRKQRAQVHGGANRWASTTHIGEHSKKLIEESDKKRQEYKNTKKYKEWEKKVQDFEDRYSNEDYYYKNQDKYDKEWDALMKAEPKKNFNDVREFTIQYTSTGRKYSNNYINKGGKDLSIAYLKDLGYDDKTAKNFVERMARHNRTLGTI